MPLSPLRRALRTLLVLIVLGPVLLSPAVAAASEDGRSSIRPSTDDGRPRSSFTFDLTPGGTVQDSFRLLNKTGDPITFDLYSADARNNPDGSFVLLGAREPRTDIGAWVHLPVGQVTVGPGAETEVPFTLVVPADAEPGDHAGGVVALAVDAAPTTAEDGVALSVRTGVGVRIYGRVDGPTRSSLVVTQLDVTVDGSPLALGGGPASGTVTYEITNTGNVRNIPTIDLDVAAARRLFRDNLASGEQLAELLPGGTITGRYRFSGVPAIGPLTVHVSVRGLGGGDERDDTVWSTPWLLLALGLVAGAVVVARRRRRARRRARPPAGEG